ncbi:hypothetical protein GOV03_03445 [Candidatus Woesearchaeota archaeon]|nr:hypothetical protein [Candidatus Woesearchaeota archaeon]
MSKKRTKKKFKLPAFWEKVEHYNAKLIPVALILLLFVIIFELFIHIENHTVEFWVHMIDYFVIAVFVIDLIFLGIHSKSTRFFFKSYWLDIIAIFPFVFALNVVNNLYKAVIATERFVIGQAIFHETLEAGKSAKILTKTGRFTKMGARILRILTKSHFLTKITHHHSHHQKRKSKKFKNKKRTTK